MRKLSLALLVVLLMSCTSRRVPAPVSGEPVCADFMMGNEANKFKGALAKPVKLTVLDGSRTVSERLLLGKRSATDEDAKVVVEDDDETYIVRWAQCSNQFAPRRVGSKQDRFTDNRTGYDCGAATTYKTIDLKVVQGEPKSRRLTWQPPPNPTCLKGKLAKPRQAASAAAPTAAPTATPKPGASASANASASASAKSTDPTKKADPKGGHVDKDEK